MKAYINVFIIFVGFALPFLCIGQLSDFKDTLSDPSFVSPIDHKIRLAGSFGELRSNHFHAGIDIKSSKGEEGDVIRASDAGFVSRIKIQRGGYGQVLYIDHPSGYTSVYAHLQAFAPSLHSFIIAQQYANKSYEVDIYPEPGKFAFEQGAIIGKMGNTGRSYGPHLHFEIRETITEIPVNPYLFEIGPTDKKSPLLYAVEAHGLDNEHRKIWSSVIDKNGDRPVIEIPAWRAGLAIQTFDQMDGADNKNGIYSIEMHVDDSLHFSHVMEKVGFHVTRYINSHIDYSEKISNNRTLTKCYVAPGNKLDFYPQVKNFGEIKLFKNEARKVDIVIKDFAGNETTYACLLKRRDAKEGEIKQPTFQKFLKYNEENNFKLGSSRFYFPKNALDKNSFISYEEQESDGQLCFSLNKKDDPMFSYPIVSVPVLSSIDSSLYEKVMLIHEEKISFGGHVEGDSLRVRIGNFGKYCVIADTIAPTIEVGSFLAKAKGKPYFRFAIYDNYDVKGFASDIKYDVFIDGEWTIAPLKALGNVLIVPLDDVSSGKHSIKIKIEDQAGNVTIWERSFEN